MCVCACVWQRVSDSSWVQYMDSINQFMLLYNYHSFICAMILWKKWGVAKPDFEHTNIDLECRNNGQSTLASNWGWGGTNELLHDLEIDIRNEKYDLQHF